MKIALAQMDVVPGRPEKNVKKMLAMIEEAKEKHADVVAFPEMAVSGYLLSDLWLDESFCADLMGYNEILREASDNIAIAYGNVFLDSTRPNKDGRSRKYNAA